MTKKNKELCVDCRKRIARYECVCGLKFCGKCSDDGSFCPADEQEIHEVSRINK